jgi:putative tricarboxylic transport membrane protein
MLLILNLPLIGLFVRLLYIPGALLYPLIMAISVIGVYALNASVLDLYLLLFFGVVGYAFDKLDIPLAPLVLALVLGDIMEESFRQALTISGGSLAIFFRSGIAATLIVLSAVLLITPLVLSRRRKPGSPAQSGST